MRRIAGAFGLFSYFVRHRTAANLLLASMVVLGLAAIPQMRAQFFPDIVSEHVDVSVWWGGAGAEAVDEGLISAIEPALLAVEGVRSVESRAADSQAAIWVEFEPGWDMSRATDAVERAVAGIEDLPDEAEEPEIERRSWSDRVTDVVITGPVGADQLGRIADTFKQRLFQAGVTRTEIRGVAAPEIRVEVPSPALMRYDLTLAEIARAIGGEVDANPAGDVNGAARIRAGTESRSAEAVADIVLRAGPGGDLLRVGDVGRVVVEGADRGRAYYVGENPAVSLRVDRAAQGDALEIESRVRDVAAALRPTLPAGVEIDLIRTRADYISGRLQILLDNALTGLALVVVLLFLFLNARTAIWVAAGIPAALIAAIALMYAGGLTFNMISLFALIITLGIVVDDAIVVGEHADFRARRLGEPPKVAAENAASRMFAPVFSSTVTTVIAFFALVTVGGTFGTLIADIPFTVIAVLIASLVECFLILPNHMAHALAHTGRERWYDWPSRQVNRGLGWVRERLFRPLMRLVIWARYPVMAGAVTLLALQATLLVTGDVQWRFFDRPETSSITGNFVMQPGAERSDTREQLTLVQEALAQVSQDYADTHGTAPVSYAISEIGGSAGRGLSGTDNTDPDLLGGISVELIDQEQRPYSSFDMVADLEEAVAEHPMLEQLSFRGWRAGPGGDAIDVRLSGARSATLKAAAEQLKDQLSQFPEVSALEDSLPYDMEELTLELTPQGEALGFTIDGVGGVLRDRLSGIEAATFPAGTRSSRIQVELPEDEITADFLGRTMLPTPSGTQVPLSDIVTVNSEQGFSTIWRRDGVREVSVTGDLDQDDATRANEIREILTDELLPQLRRDFGISTEVSGLAEEEDEFLTDALIGFALCLVGIYLTLSWIFASWTRPAVVMSVIPFGLIGAIWGHYLWDVPMSIFTVVGLIGMTGIVINDSIVLITTIDEYATDRPLRRAIVDAACDRLRAVLLTTATTVLGLAPLLYEGSSQAEFLKPTVITLVYGLGFGMALVLLLVPALCAAQNDIGRALSTLRLALRPRLGLAVPLCAFAVAALFAVTLGAELVLGAALVAPLGPGAGAALASFAIGAGGLSLAGFLAAALTAGRGRAAVR